MTLLSEAERIRRGAMVHRTGQTFRDEANRYLLDHRVRRNPLYRPPFSPEVETEEEIHVEG